MSAAADTPAAPRFEELHAPLGAQAVVRQGLRLPGWYGPDRRAACAAEYQALREGAALVDLAERALLSVSGPLRHKFLHGVLSQDLASLAAGQGRPAALMDPRGHLLALMRVLAGPETLWLELPAAVRARVQSQLEHYRVAAPVRFTAPNTAVFGLLGPAAGELLASAAGPTPWLNGGEPAAESHAELQLGGCRLRARRAGDLPAAGYALHCAAEDVPALWRALTAAGARPLGREALDAARIEDGCPWYGPDVDESHLLHETGQVEVYHSGTKGCYVGQEVIARLQARGGHVNKALRGLRLSQPAEEGAAIHAGGQEVGRVTSAAVSPRHGPIAMGYVHRNHFAPGQAVEVGGQPASVTLLPLAAEGARREPGTDVESV